MPRGNPEVFATTAAATKVHNAFAMHATVALTVALFAAAATVVGPVAALQQPSTAPTWPLVYNATVNVTSGGAPASPALPQRGASDIVTNTYTLLGVQWVDHDKYSQ